MMFTSHANFLVQVSANQFQTNPTGRTEASKHRHYKAYYQGFILAVILCWCPLKIVALIAPYFVLVWYLLISQSLVAVRNTLLWILAFAIIILIHAAIDPNFVIANGVIAMITFGAFIFTFIVPIRDVKNTALFLRMQNLVQKILIFEGILGVIQAVYGFLNSGTFDSNNGDAVAGTISMRLIPDGTLSNPMFAINVAFLLLMLLPVLVIHKQGWMAACIGAFVLVLASVMHVLIFLAVAIFGAVLLYRPAIKSRVQRFILVLTILFVFPALTFTLLATNWSTLPVYLQGFLAGASPKALAIQRVLIDIPPRFPWMPWIGLGPGQFTSNASEISSGFYFSNGQTVPLLPVKMSLYANKYLVDLWTQYSYGSTYQPRSSWLTIYSEFGIFVFLAIFSYIFFTLVRTASFVRTTEQKWFATSYTASIILLMLLGFQYNYWEVPQAIFIGVMCIKVLHANIFTVSPKPRLLDLSSNHNKL